MGITYTTVDRIYQIVPDLSDITALTSEHVVTFAEGAEAEINARISQNYTVPITPTPPLLRAVATDWACYRILALRVFTQEQLQNSTWPDAFKEAKETVEDIASGKITLIDPAGTVVSARTDIAKVTSNTKGRTQTFWEGGEYDQVRDKDKIDDGLDARGL